MLLNEMLVWYGMAAIMQAKAMARAMANGAVKQNGGSGCRGHNFDVPIQLGAMHSLSMRKSKSCVE